MRFAAALTVLVSSAIGPACSRSGRDAPSSRDTQARPTATANASNGTLAEDPRAIPTYVVRRLQSDESITIDGVLEEPAWKSAASTRAFVHPGTGLPLGPNAPLGGTARLRYDSDFLYIAFEARDTDLRGNFAPDSVDPHLWSQDTVEIMLDPDGDGDNRDYYELQINPQGLVFDSQFDDYNQPRVAPNGPFGHQEFDSGARRAVTILGTMNDSSDVDRGYLVEAALPFRKLTKARRIPPAPNDEWRANFYVMQDNGGVSWSPILGLGNFHKAARFGRLRFAD